MNLKIRPPRRRTRFERAVKAAHDVDINPPKAVKSGATAAAAAVAASAVVSALRRRADGR